MNRSNWSTERRTKAALANGGEEDDTSAGGDETSTLSGGRRISRRTMLRDEIVEDSDEDDTDTDDELPGAYAITRSTENNAEAIQQEWDPTEQTQSPLDCSSSRTADEERESDPLSIPLGAQVRPASSKDLNAKESRRNISNRIRRPYNERKWLVVLGAALCVAGVAIVTTVVILVVSANEQQVQVGDPEPDRCEYKDQITQVDPFLQCRCRGEISIINEDVEDAMESVKNFLSTKYVKQFPANSCEPQNKALVWVSASYAKAGGNELLMPRWQVQTRYALAVFFDTSGGNNWPSLTNWLTGNKVCAWANIQCDSDGQVIRLELKDNNVIGSINPELGLLTKLQSLDISRNKLSGSIPPDVWALPNLEELLLGYNDIGGEIPSSLRDYSTSLKKLSLPETKIEGKLPSLTGLAALVEINLNLTRLTGTIPEDWGGLMQLELLDLSWIRYLDGWLPTSFSALTGLKSINLSESGLAGSIPEYMAEWTSLEHLSFVNAMRGSIPTFFGSFTNLVSLVIDFSGVTGTIPSELGLCTELEMLGIGLNRLKGTLPRELGNLKNLIEFTLDGNKDISGSVPAEFGDLEKLEKLSISGTGISGTIPNELCRIEISITESDFLDCTCCKGDDTA